MGIKKLIGTAALGVKRHSPELLFGGGVIAGAAALYLTYKATPKYLAIKEKYAEAKKDADIALDIGETEIDVAYTKEDYKNDIKIIASHKALDAAKTWAPVGAAALTSLVCFLAGFGILKHRLAGAVTLLATTTEAFEAYRQRVRDDVGKDKEMEYFTGNKLEDVKVTEVGEDGKKHTVTKKQWCLDPDLADIPFLSPYAITITPEHKLWKNNGGNPMLMEAQLKIIQENLTTRLHMNGFLTLNDVLCGDQGLGFDCRSDLYDLDPNVINNVGWLDTKNEGADRCVNFGCWNSDGGLDYAPGRFIILDLNCDGWIMGRLPNKPKHGEELIEACKADSRIEK